jgi:DNA-binding transcriptional ArsR family regulator
MESREVVPILSALAQETRLEALRKLVEAGPEGLAAGEIARRLDVPAPTLSFHLKAMLHAGLVTARRAGRSLIYAADFETLRGVVGFLTENCCAAATSDSGRRRSRSGRRAAS